MIMANKSKIGIFIIGIVLSIVVSARPAAAVTIYVDATNSSGVEDGTQTYPFNTITEGIDATSHDMVPPDVVSVAPGIYVGPIMWKSGVILQSEQGPEATIVDGDGAGSVFIPPSRPVGHTSGIPRGFVDGFTIRNGYNLVPVYSRYAPYQTGEMNVDNCILEDATNAVPGSTFAHLNMDRTVIRNVNRAVTGTTGTFYRLNNVTIDNVETGMRLYGTYLNVHNTTISNADTAGIEARCAFYYGCGAIDGSHLNLWNAEVIRHTNNRGEPRFAVTSQFSVDPLFVDPPLDHHLSAGSPLIDAGVIVGLPFLGDAPDIGAYEYSLNIPELVENLVEVIQEVPPEAFPNAAEQRQNALTNKLEAVLEMLDNITETTPISEQIIILNEALDKLQNDILAKTDGYLGGNPNNDWIETQEGQELVYPIVMELIEAVQAELAAITGTA
jgi:hypothetical protein